jgi:transketolase C-terminal domain/subunit
MSSDFGMTKLIFRLTRVFFAYKQGRSVSGGNTTSDASDVYLLTRGRAWAISLSVRSALSEKFLSASIIGMDTEDLLYRLLLGFLPFFCLL